MTRRDLEQYVKDFLGSLTDPLIGNIRGGAEWLLFESFIYSVIARTLRELKFDIVAENVHGNVFKFRKGHGLAKSDSSYLSVVGDKGTHGELQKSIRVDGRSRVDHELDVALVNSRYRKRKNTSNPIYSDLLLFLECKSQSRRLTKVTATQYIGLVVEMNRNVPNGIASNTTAPAISRVVDRLLSKYNAAFRSVDPSSTNTFTEWLKVELPKSWSRIVPYK